MSILDLVYPPRCIFCGARLGQKGLCICDECQNSLPWAERTEGEVRAPWLYRGPVRKMLHRFKFGGASDCARTLGAVMAGCVSARECDAVTWVPCSFLRRLKRRYDQSFLLAREVARALDKPLTPLLTRKHHRAAQYRQQDAGARAGNVKNAFRVRAGRRDAIPKRVLLADDIYTTGATFRECKRVLLEAGAERVILVAAARK